MPRSRGSEMPQRQPQRTPLHLKMTACSEANALHGRQAAADRSSFKPPDERRRSPRSPLHEIKKSGTKVADLETKLSKAQEELQKLKDQLASAEAGKLEAEQALEKAKKQIPALPQSQSVVECEGAEKPSPPPENSKKDTNTEPDLKTEEEEQSSGLSPAATNSFDVEKEKEEEIEEDAKKDEIFLEKKEEENEKDANGDLNKEKKVEESIEQEEVEESSEVLELKANLLEKETEIEFLFEENAIFKRKAREEAEELAATARLKEDELKARLSLMEEDLHGSRAKADQLEQQLVAAQGEKAALEAELKRLKVQTDQWRKAAEAAASVLTGSGDEGKFGGRRVSERCGSMDKHLLGGSSGYAGWSLMAEDMEEDGVPGSGRWRKSAAGIRRLGELWKKKRLQK